MSELKDEKILIVISSVMVWSNTPQREKVRLIRFILINSLFLNQKEGEVIPKDEGLEDFLSENDDDVNNLLEEEEP